ncbi:hypothetical protein [Actinomadura violacea]|uniref:Class I SAM-dependent methyltransferase n=1 Tax=Actinomadura violacea TaxID=2819934 RepID=A0ABS3S7G8_9ACTN|nr:hypothetical protein [Actinomadura violacea]MBO2464953.1 hypothetical protein [Actinomadura violacea]
MQQAVMVVTESDVQRTYEEFYRIPRAGQIRLSDGGGPFGFDIHLALLVDQLIGMLGCDAICETGSFVGDTTLYLAARHPELPVRSCDIDPRHVAVTRRRLTGHSNATVECCDSPRLIADVTRRHTRPLCFLDAHWGDPWPLEQELELLATRTPTGGAVAVVHDFDIGHPRFSFDSYGGRDCGPGVLAMLGRPPAVYFTPRPEAPWPLPCLQTGRRAGAAVLAFGLDDSPLRNHPLLDVQGVPAPAPAPAR